MELGDDRCQCRCVLLLSAFGTAGVFSAAEIVVEDRADLLGDGEIGQDPGFVQVYRRPVAARIRVSPDVEDMSRRSGDLFDEYNGEIVDPVT